MSIAVSPAHHTQGGGAPAAGKKGEKSSEEAAAEAGDSDGGDDDADDQDDDSESDADMEPSFRYRLITSLHNQRETHMIDMGSDGEDDDGGMGAQLLIYCSSVPHLLGRLAFGRVLFQRVQAARTCTCAQEAQE